MKQTNAERDLETIRRILAHEKAAEDECTARLQPYRETVQAMNVQISVQLSRNSLKGHVAIPWTLEERGELPPQYASSLKVAVCQNGKTLIWEETVIGTFFRLVGGPPRGIVLHPDPLDQNCAFEQSVERMLDQAREYLAYRQSGAEQHFFRMSVDDCLPASSFPAIGRTGVLLTGIIEKGKITVGAQVRIVGRDGTLLATATVEAIFGQRSLMGASPRPRKSAPPPYEAALLLAGTAVKKEIRPGRCSVIA